MTEVIRNLANVTSKMHILHWQYVCIRSLQHHSEDPPWPAQHLPVFLCVDEHCDHGAASARSERQARLLVPLDKSSKTSEEHKKHALSGSGSLSSGSGTSAVRELTVRGWIDRYRTVHPHLANQVVYLCSSKLFASHLETRGCSYHEVRTVRRRACEKVRTSEVKRQLHKRSD
jgi:hypothetical protein